jgi:alanine dehydrogenase
LPIYLKESDVAEFADMPSAIAALRDAFLAQARGEATNVPRTRWAVGKRRLNVMGGGIRPSGRYALKAYGSSAYHALLYSEEEGLLAVIEANALGQLRTGAASALASERMARRLTGRVGLIGAGRQARTQAVALQAIGAIGELAVFARDRGRLEAFCAGLAKDLGVRVRAASSAADAAANADIVVTATTSSQPVLMNAWLTAGAHVNAMGANAASRRELDPEIVLRASMLVTDDIEQAKAEAGEFIDLHAAGRLDWKRVTPLHQVIAAPNVARAEDAVTVFKSLGVGLEDVAIASLVYDRAVASRRFTPL